MAKVTIGEVEYEIPELSFDALERAWPYIEIAMTTVDPIKAPAAGIAIVAAGIMDTDHFDKTKFGIEETEMLGEDQVFQRVLRFLKKQLKARELEQVRVNVNLVCEEAGLDPVLGERSPPGADQPPRENPSMETAPSS